MAREENAMPNVEKKKGEQKTGTAAAPPHGAASRHFIDSLIFLHVDESIVRVVEENARELDDEHSPEEPQMDSE
jgi:hypothetical protein